jgi:hypothetical protein
MSNPNHPNQPNQEYSRVTFGPTGGSPMQRQSAITDYLSGSPSTFGPEVGSYHDSDISTKDRVEILKTLSYNFFDDNTFAFSYYISTHRVPPFENLCAQFGFINCRTVEEKYNLLRLYRTSLFQCYPDLFFYKPLGILYEYFCEDRIDDFIIESYSRMRISDNVFMWFMNRRDIVKHGQNYAEIQRKKQSMFPRKI